jgi:carboxynorspermidine decarboxylase
LTLTHGTYIDRIATPAYVVETDRLRTNLAVLAGVRERTGCRILLAQKGFAMWHLYPMMREYLDGVCASSPWEARLGREEFGGEVHAFAAAYSENDVRELVRTCDEIDFNSFAQWQRYREIVEQAPRDIRCGLRINPECSTQRRAIYDPCAPFSRLGICRQGFEGELLDGISGLHFHTLCEQDADALAVTLKAVEERFGDILPAMEWVNFGGGHHITRPGYNIQLMEELINSFQQRYDVQVYLEPGEAVALNVGMLVATVLDVVHNGMDIAILDVSCTAHMPDVLEMPYRPEVWLDGEAAGLPETSQFDYRLAGLSCLAGDVIGDYSFNQPLRPGMKLVFGDMAHYTMVKTTMFNGVQHPAIMTYDADHDTLETIRSFTYPDYKTRLS